MERHRGVVVHGGSPAEIGERQMTAHQPPHRLHEHARNAPLCMRRRVIGPTGFSEGFLRDSLHPVEQRGADIIHNERSLAI